MRFYKKLNEIEKFQIVTKSPPTFSKKKFSPETGLLLNFTELFFLSHMLLIKVERKIFYSLKEIVLLLSLNLPQFA